MRSILRLLTPFTLCMLAANGWLLTQTVAAESPNVIVILTDDQGWGDLSINGNTNLATPNIDSLGRQGTRFDRFYVCPVCSPTRAEFLTGRYHPRLGVHDTSRGGERMNLGERTIAEVFKAAGYRTAAFGKWHNGNQYPYHPNARGFQEFYGFCSGHWGDYFSPPLDHNGKLVTGRGFLADDITEHAVRFIEQNKEHPFFLYLPLPTPHAPMQVPDAYWSRFKEKKLDLHGDLHDQEDEAFTRAALAMVENVDYNVGRVLRKLDELKLSSDTLVVFFCDNGPNSDRWNGGMKGRKGSTDEGGVRSPLFMRWPVKLAAGKLITQISGAIDLLPTLADLAQVPLTGIKPLDGVSLKPLLCGEASSIPDRKLFSHWGGKVSVRTQHFRLDQQGRLFDMVVDPSQKTSVNDKHSDLTQELSAAVAAWRKELLAGLPDDQRPFTVGHPDSTFTQLPAQDGNPHGNIKRSAKAPNCSYFTNWTSTNDRLTWPIEVLEAGNYRVDCFYACAATDIGIELTLSMGPAQVVAKVDEAHDPPALGAEHDRVPRETESLVKDFKVLHFDVIRLEKGAGELVLQATELPGQHGPEVQMLVLRRVP